MKPNYILVFLCAVLLTVGFSWLKAVPDTSPEWSENVLFFCATLAFLQKYEASGKAANIVLCMSAGRVILELPIRILDFTGTLSSLFEAIAALLGIVGAAIYFKFCNRCVLISLLVAAVLINTFVSPLFEELHVVLNEVSVD